MDDRIRSVIEQYAKVNVDVATLDDRADLYQAGMTSHAAVSLMLGLENEFDVEFPDRMLTRGTFECIASIRKGLGDLTAEAAA
jgi:acyl carrier protein